ncbi:hypothetical protein [Tropicimonas marinistellae]|uniref:hypothetical protein n=1 Tax=Tropicimonas marinistellae TaxID=1739787 RepID=UPI00082F54F5|nr:hypothetical protein [Tropicimonas marinistellae]
MRLVYHVGLHSTDEDRALQCLLRNAARLQNEGTIISPPGQFRPVLREAMLHLRGVPASREIQAQILASVTNAKSANRLVFSSDSFLCVPKRAITGGTLYPLAAERAPWIRNLFPDDPAEFLFAVRNPATLIPALQARFHQEEGFAQYLARILPESLSWTDMVVRFRDAVPDCPVTVWCNEDTPLIWYDVLEALCGSEEARSFDGVHDFYRSIMTAEGVAQLETAIQKMPPDASATRKDTVATHLAAHAVQEAVEVEYDLPGWTAERIARLSERYEADIAELKELDGVRVLSP